MNPLFPYPMLDTRQLLLLVWFLVALVLIDLALKGWALWRAARMDKQRWFIALLVINSFGILPTVFLVMTNNEYKRVTRQPKNALEPREGSAL